MHEIINEKVSVITVYDRAKGTVTPKRIKWQGRVFDITKIGYHHRIRHGRTMQHIFSVSTSAMAFRLRLDTSNLHWTLEEVSDGLTA